MHGDVVRGVYVDRDVTVRTCSNGSAVRPRVHLNGAGRK